MRTGVRLGPPRSDIAALTDGMASVGDSSAFNAKSTGTREPDRKPGVMGRVILTGVAGPTAVMKAGSMVVEEATVQVVVVDETMESVTDQSLTRRSLSHGCLATAALAAHITAMGEDAMEVVVTTIAGSGDGGDGGDDPSASSKGEKLLRRALHREAICRAARCATGLVSIADISLMRDRAGCETGLAPIAGESPSAAIRCSK